ncbi:hypothetical protein UA08_02468 [Talaromyces atroroseus]|uniref:Zn(2)-C6 fungal-type domain-containing protein n=1 Tax=Talaromyces atroroseus TaxID=1441469 RepID=A0A225AWS1_TALAT|nr:hypothetical protein UA08_02468 [Talaromyces atroroseus]OKL61768.1 hypothetical protein UA08_02468 [Talaromyces atroroseus]
MEHNSRRRHRPRVAKEKRKRAEQACERCRRRKSRCVVPNSDATSAACSRCASSRQRCSLMSTESARDPDVVRLLKYRDRAEPVRRPAQAMPTETQHKTIDITAAGSTSDVSPEDAASLDLDWSNAQGDFIPRIREAMFLSPGHRDPIRLYEGNASPLGSTPELHIDQRLLRNTVKVFPPKQVADFLVSTCIEFASDSFFYFHQTAFRRDLDSIYASHDDQPLNCSCVVISLMVFALGSQFAHLASKPSPTPRPDLSYDPGVTFVDSIHPLVPNLIQVPSITSVQVFFLMAIYFLPSDARNQSYFYMGLALRIAISLGMHRRSTMKYCADPRSAEISNRLWWSLYSMERLVSVKIGRPGFIREDEVDAPLPTALPALDEVQINNNIHHQIANASLTRILSRLVQKINLAFISQTQTASRSLEVFKNELHHWQEQLPPTLALENLLSKGQEMKSPRAVAHLHQNYHIAWIIMCRIPLLRIVRGRLKRVLVDTSFNEPTDPTTIEHGRLCVRAAKEVLQLFELLWAKERLAPFSFTDFHGCSTATTIILLAGILERDSEYNRWVDFGLASLRFIAAENRMARVGVQCVEHFQAIADEAVMKMQHRLRRPPDLVSSETGSGYDSWLQWLAETGQAGPNEEQSGDDNDNDCDDEGENENDKTPSQYDTVESVTGRAEVHGSSVLQPTTEYMDAISSTSHDPDSEAPATLPTMMGWTDAPLTSAYDDPFILGLTGLDVMNFSNWNDL